MKSGTLRYSLVIFCVLFLEHEALCKTITVCKSCNTKSIGSGIAKASPFDTLRIKPGTYKEYDLRIAKPLTILGDKEVVLDVNGKGSGLLIEHDRVTVRQMTIKNVLLSYVKDLAGIKILGANYCRVENVRFYNTFFGLYVSKSDNCKLINNTIQGLAQKESSAGNGIHLWYCKKALVKKNTITGHRDGIYFEFVENSIISHNHSSEQLRYGLHFMFSSNNRYAYNTFKNNGAGVAVMYSKDIEMYRNNFSENWSSISNGLLLKDITDSKIVKNNFDKNTMGIYAEGSNRILIKNNNFRNNGWAIKILGNCDENEILYNNFISNTFEVVTNSHTNNNKFDHNYWSDYSGYDLNKDGVGDVPHTPIKLFSYVTEQIPSSIVLLRSSFVDVLNLAEKITPVITPESYRDENPKMKEIKW